MKNIQDQFISWLLGEKVEFPFFKDFQEVKMPEMPDEVPDADTDEEGEDKQDADNAKD